MPLFPEQESETAALKTAPDFEDGANLVNSLPRFPEQESETVDLKTAPDFEDGSNLVKSLPLKSWASLVAPPVRRAGIFLIFSSLRKSH